MSGKMSVSSYVIGCVHTPKAWSVYAALRLIKMSVSSCVTGWVALWFV